ncbi:Uncharacterised protein [Bordetella pertussis]|nr:Uncharacterised protein [Bordetella pertussis]
MPASGAAPRSRSVRQAATDRLAPAESPPMHSRARSTSSSAPWASSQSITPTISSMARG